jgi:hypothetical protein
MRSPLSRKPLAHGACLVGLLLSAGVAVSGCSSTSVLYSPVGPHQRNAALSVYHDHGLFHLGSCGFSQDGETYHIALLGQHQVYTRNNLELRIDEQVIQEFDGRVQLLEKNRVLIDLYVLRGRKRVPLPVNGVRKHD